ncbi:Kelch 10 [Paramuricea clavata]|uniref:Kelch 10 n=1 Tax=Paramuricea clavata TaxID=317549 RepID=A0A6S7KKL9_PARCT|nr:Kelch 10 [Paramuricea clavata]
MAVVAYKDNIIVLGGYDGSKSLNEALMFNATTHEYKRLPSMLEKRDGCAAVIMGDVIVVMGGRSSTYLKSVEYYVIGDSAWQELPAMNLARYNATACVYA